MISPSGDFTSVVSMSDGSEQPQTINSKMASEATQLADKAPRGREASSSQRQCIGRAIGRRGITSLGAIFAVIHQCREAAETAIFCKCRDYSAIGSFGAHCRHSSPRRRLSIRQRTSCGCAVSDTLFAHATHCGQASCPRPVIHIRGSGRESAPVVE